MTEQKPPLWVAMQKASMFENMNWHDPQTREGYAAMICAVRDWLVPEEKPLTEMGFTELHTLQVERQRLRTMLSAEGERAKCRGKWND